MTGEPNMLPPAGQAAAASDPSSPPSLLSLAPVPELLARTRGELASDFNPRRAIRISRAPGRLDVMGGIADYTGSLVCPMTLDRAAAVVSQERDDRQLQLFSFNLFDENKPFTFRVPLDALASFGAEVLRRELAEPGRQWAAYVVGCLFVLHEQGFLNLRDPSIKGMNLAILSTVPLGGGVSSSAALEVAAMMNFRDRFDLMKPAAGRSLRQANVSEMNPMLLSELCQRAENQIVGAPCGIMDQVSSCWGEAGSLLRMVCQPHELQAQLATPPGMRFVGINSAVRHSVGGSAYRRTRAAAFMAHKIILEKMREIGARAGRRLVADPMGGYLANLDADDYRRMFRSLLPEEMAGKDFLDRLGGTIDPVAAVEPDEVYPVQHAADHHVLEARRVRNFAVFLEEATAHTDPAKKGLALDKAGHLMYASHQSYTHDAMLGAEECDLLVAGVRQRERAGLYGARITGGGSGGTVAVLAENTARADEALGEIMHEYQQRTGRTPELFTGASPGAWHVGTRVVVGDLAEQ